MSTGLLETCRGFK